MTGRYVSYGFSEVEEALARLNFIAQEKRSAFSNRLKNMQRKGFPSGVNTGRGRAADYRPEHLVQLALALELITFGYSPEKAIEAVTISLEEIAAGVYRATDFDETIICNFRPRGLSDLQHDEQFGRDEIPLQCMTASEAVKGIELVTDAQFAGSRVAMFSLTGIVSLCASLIGWDDEEDVRPEFYERLNDWAKGIIDGHS